MKLIVRHILAIRYVAVSIRVRCFDRLIDQSCEPVTLVQQVLWRSDRKCWSVRVDRDIASNVFVSWIRCWLVMIRTNWMFDRSTIRISISNYPIPFIFSFDRNIPAGIANSSFIIWSNSTHPIMSQATRFILNINQWIVLIREAMLYVGLTVNAFLVVFIPHVHNIAYPCSALFVIVRRLYVSYGVYSCNAMLVDCLYGRSKLFLWFEEFW